MSLRGLPCSHQGLDLHLLQQNLPLQIFPHRIMVDHCMRLRVGSWGHTLFLSRLSTSLVLLGPNSYERPMRGGYGQTLHYHRSARHCNRLRDAYLTSADDLEIASDHGR